MPNQNSILVNINSPSTPQIFSRIEIGEKLIDEKFLQEALFASPGCLPLDEFGGNFAPAACIGREILKIDLLYLSADGFITIVETKLWKNPEARRTAVAQILDYAKKLSCWDYEQLESAVKRKLGFDESLYAWLCENDETGEGMPEESIFIDSVSRNLQGGHFLLLIVGDGIREGVQDLTESLNQAPQLGFTFGLVEMACYRWSEDQLLLSPSVVARTQEIERAVVRIEMKDSTRESIDVDVSTNPDDIETTPGLQSFMETLADRTSSSLANQLDSFCRHFESSIDEVSIVCHKKYLLKCKYFENDKEESLWIITANNEGKVALGGHKHWKLGCEEVRQVIEQFWNSVAQLVPALQPKLLESGSMSRPTCSLEMLLQHSEQLKPLIVEYTSNLTSLE